MIHFVKLAKYKRAWRLEENDGKVAFKRHISRLVRSQWSQSLKNM